MLAPRITEMVDARAMEFNRVVARRRMVRDFEPDPVDAEALDRIISYALRGPSAGFTQGVELLVLEGSEQTGRYWDACFPIEGRDHFRWPGVMQAPILVVVLAHEEAYRRRYQEPDKASRRQVGQPWPAPWWHVDSAFAAMLILLGAVDEGLGALFFAAFEPAALAAEFGVPHSYTPTGVIAIGHPRPHAASRSLARGRRPKAEVVHRGRW